MVQDSCCYQRFQSALGISKLGSLLEMSGSNLRGSIFCGSQSSFLNLFNFSRLHCSLLSGKQTFQAEGKQAKATHWTWRLRFWKGLCCSQGMQGSLVVGGACPASKHLSKCSNQTLEMSDSHAAESQAWPKSFLHFKSSLQSTTRHLSSELVSRVQHGRHFSYMKTCSQRANFCDCNIICLP